MHNVRLGRARLGWTGLGWSGLAVVVGGRSVAAGKQASKQACLVARAAFAAVAAAAAASRPLAGMLLLGAAVVVRLIFLTFFLFGASFHPPTGCFDEGGVGVGVETRNQGPDGDCRTIRFRLSARWRNLQSC
ncbi:hypothetical protein IWX90DRAFT_418330 [Phyllosticta citrichinensis]|uniref:Secreted protein n=1 Tax=Phyllosticta citrichinensis TaxID=1130410 RepID=A0ABR1XID2_9PEZI